MRLEIRPPPSHVPTAKCERDAEQAANADRRSRRSASRTSEAAGGGLGSLSARQARARTRVAATLRGRFRRLRLRFAFRFAGLVHFDFARDDARRARAGANRHAAVAHELLGICGSPSARLEAAICRAPTHVERHELVLGGRRTRALSQIVLEVLALGWCQSKRSGCCNRTRTARGPNPRA